MRTRRHRAIGKVLLQRKVNNRPIWIDDKCEVCRSKLVPDSEAWELGFKDEWDCPVCLDGIYLDAHPGWMNEMKKELERTKSRRRKLKFGK